MYWWDGVPNFGDAIGPDLVRALLPVDNIRHARAGDEGVLLGPGSILDYASKFRDVVIWGTGFDPHYGRPQIKNATILAVRGPLTAKALGINVPVLGDPGLLLPEIYPLKPTPNDVALYRITALFENDYETNFFVRFGQGTGLSTLAIIGHRWYRRSVVRVLFSANHSMGLSWLMLMVCRGAGGVAGMDDWLRSNGKIGSQASVYNSETFV